MTYTIQVSSDGITWTIIATNTGAGGGNNSVNFTPISAWYVKNEAGQVFNVRIKKHSPCRTEGFTQWSKNQKQKSPLSAWA
jgi:hypothetical protein